MSEEYASVTDAIKMSGLRLLMIRGVPSPWTQAARGLFEVMGIDFTRVELKQDEPRELMNEWTGQDAFPAAMYDDERARTGWEEILWLAERLAPERSLAPKDAAERAKMFGLSRELFGEMGLCWCRRLMSLGGAMKGGGNPVMNAMQTKFGSSEAEMAQAQARVVEVLNLLGRQLAESKAAGHRYLMGPDLTALDIFWAASSNLVLPLPIEQLPIIPAMIPVFTASDPETLAALTPELLAHRDFIYAEHLGLPREL